MKEIITFEASGIQEIEKRIQSLQSQLKRMSDLKIDFSGILKDSAINGLNTSLSDIRTMLKTPSGQIISPQTLSSAEQALTRIKTITTDINKNLSGSQANTLVRSTNAAQKLITKQHQKVLEDAQAFAQKSLTDLGFGNYKQLFQKLETELPKGLQKTVSDYVAHTTSSIDKFLENETNYRIAQMDNPAALRTPTQALSNQKLADQYAFPLKMIEAGQTDLAALAVQSAVTHRQESTILGAAKGLLNRTEAQLKTSYDLNTVTKARIAYERYAKAYRGSSEESKAYFIGSKYLQSQFKNDPSALKEGMVAYEKFRSAMQYTNDSVRDLAKRRVELDDAIAKKQIASNALVAENFVDVASDADVAANALKGLAQQLQQLGSAKIAKDAIGTMKQVLTDYYDTLAEAKPISITDETVSQQLKAANLEGIINMIDSSAAKVADDYYTKIEDMQRIYQHSRALAASYTTQAIPDQHAADVTFTDTEKTKEAFQAAIDRAEQEFRSKAYETSDYLYTRLGFGSHNEELGVGTHSGLLEIFADAGRARKEVFEVNSAIDNLASVLSKVSGVTPFTKMADDAKNVKTTVVDLATFLRSINMDMIKNNPAFIANAVGGNVDLIGQITDRVVDVVGNESAGTGFTFRNPTPEEAGTQLVKYTADTSGADRAAEAFQHAEEEARDFGAAAQAAFSQANQSANVLKATVEGLALMRGVGSISSDYANAMATMTKVRLLDSGFSSSDNVAALRSQYANDVDMMAVIGGVANGSINRESYVQSMAAARVQAKGLAEDIDKAAKKMMGFNEETKKAVKFDFRKGLNEFVGTLDRLRNVSQQISSQFTSWGDTLLRPFESAGNKIIGILTGIGQKVVSIGINSAKSLAKDIWEDALTNEIAVSSVKGMTENDDDYEPLLRGLIKFDRASAIADSDMYMVIRDLISVGMDVPKALQVLKQLSDAAGATGGSITMMSKAYSQMYAAGKFNAQDWNQFRNQNLGGLRQDILAVAGDIGLTKENWMEMQKAGEITFDYVEKAFERATSAGGRYFGGTEMYAASMKGSMERMFEAMTYVGRQAIGIDVDTASPIQGGLYDRLTKWINGQVDLLYQNNDEKLLKVGSWLNEKLEAIVANVLNFAGTAFSGENPVVNKIGEIFTKIWEGFSGTDWTPLIDKITGIILKIAEFASTLDWKQAFENFRDGIMDVIDVLISIGNGIKNFATQGIGKGILGMFGVTLDSVGDVIPSMIKLGLKLKTWGTIFGGIGIGAGFLAFVIRALQTLGSFLFGIGRVIKSLVVTGLPKGFSKHIRSATEEMADIAQSMSPSAVPALETLSKAKLTASLTRLTNVGTAVLGALGTGGALWLLAKAMQEISKIKIDTWGNFGKKAAMMSSAFVGMSVIIAGIAKGYGFLTGALTAGTGGIGTAVVAGLIGGAILTVGGIAKVISELAQATQEVMRTPNIDGEALALKLSAMEVVANALSEATAYEYTFEGMNKVDALIDFIKSYGDSIDNLVKISRTTISQTGDADIVVEGVKNNIIRLTDILSALNVAIESQFGSVIKNLIDSWEASTANSLITKLINTAGLFTQIKDIMAGIGNATDINYRSSLGAFVGVAKDMANDLYDSQTGLVSIYQQISIDMPNNTTGYGNRMTFVDGLITQMLTIVKNISLALEKFKQVDAEITKVRESLQEGGNIRENLLDLCGEFVDIIGGIFNDDRFFKLDETIQKVTGRGETFTRTTSKRVLVLNDEDWANMNSFFGSIAEFATNLNTLSSGLQGVSKQVKDINVKEVAQFVAEISNELVTKLNEAEFALLDAEGLPQKMSDLETVMGSIVSIASTIVTNKDTFSTYSEMNMTLPGTMENLRKMIGNPNFTGFLQDVDDLIILAGTIETEQGTTTAPGIGDKAEQVRLSIEAITSIASALVEGQEILAKFAKIDTWEILQNPIENINKMLNTFFTERSVFQKAIAGITEDDYSGRIQSVQSALEAITQIATLLINMPKYDFAEGNAQGTVNAIGQMIDQIKSIFNEDVTNSAIDQVKAFIESFAEFNESFKPTGTTWGENLKQGFIESVLLITEWVSTVFVPTVSQIEAIKMIGTAWGSNIMNALKTRLQDPLIGREIYDAINGSLGMQDYASLGSKIAAEIQRGISNSPLTLPGTVSTPTPKATIPKMAYLATGGLARGTDTIPAMLTAGEYIVRMRAVQALGKPVMDIINQADRNYYVAQALRNIVNGGATYNQSQSTTTVINNNIVQNITTKAQNYNSYQSLRRTLRV